MDDVSPDGGERGPALEELFGEVAAAAAERGVPFSVGIVGTRENLPHACATCAAGSTGGLPLGQRLQARGGLLLAGRARCDPRRSTRYFDLNNQHYPSLGRPCTAGQRAVYLDDEGDLRRCFFVGGVIGNLFRDGWTTLDAPGGCPVRTCHCYVGHMHVAELDFRAIYGDSWRRIPVLAGEIERAGARERYSAPDMPGIDRRHPGDGH